MKKVKILLLLLISVFCLYSKDVYAASASLSVSSSKVYVGGSFKATINVSAAAAWSVHLSASGPVRNCSISQADSTSNALNANKSFSATCTATGTGTITLTLSGDVTSADDGLARKVSGTRTVTVVNKPASSTPSTNNSNSKPSGPADDRSTNTNLKSLTVNGKTLTKKNNVYSMEVSNYVEKVDIAAVGADTKSKVTGTGSKNLSVGENKFSVVVTAERGNKTTYTVKVIRKEYNTFNDLDEVLKLGKDSEVQFSNNDKLTKEMLDSIINSKRKITLTKYDSEKKKTLYSFILDGNVIKTADEFNPNILLVSDNNLMEEAVNYAAGLYLDFSSCINIPEGVILRYFVGDIYNNDEKLNLYSYSDDKVTKLQEGIVVTDGYVEFNVSDSVYHLLSKTVVQNAVVKEEGLNSWMISSIVLAVIVVILVLLIIVDKMKMLNNKATKVEVVKEETENISSTPVEEEIEDKEVL